MAKIKSFTIRPAIKTTETLETLAQLRGVSKNKIVCEFLDNAVPHMEIIIDALKLAEDKNPEAFSVMAQLLKKTIIEGLDSQSDMIDDMLKKEPSQREKIITKKG